MLRLVQELALFASNYLNLNELSAHKKKINYFKHNLSSFGFRKDIVKIPRSNIKRLIFKLNLPK
jgi:hypothetical protein